MLLADWKDLMNQACRDAGHRPGCLNFHVNYTDEKGSDDECTVKRVSPPIGKKVATSTRVRLDVSCETSESEQTDTDTTDNEQGQTDTNTTDNEQSQTDTDTTDQKTNERGG
ncbi:MAG: hypothetical protein ACRDSG_14575 [Pseudonocardiaceae bacterium]